MVYEVRLTYKKDKKNSHFRKKYYVDSVSKEEAITKVTKAIKIKSVMGIGDIYSLENISAKEMADIFITAENKYIPPLLRKEFKSRHRKNKRRYKRKLEEINYEEV